MPRERVSKLLLVHAAGKRERLSNSDFSNPNISMCNDDTDVQLRKSEALGQLQGIKTKWGSFKAEPAT